MLQKPMTKKKLLQGSDAVVSLLGHGRKRRQHAAKMQ